MTRSTSHDEHDYKKHIAQFAGKPVGPRERAIAERSLRDSAMHVSSTLTAAREKDRDRHYLASTTREAFHEYDPKTYATAAAASHRLPAPLDDDYIAATGTVKPRVHLSEEEARAALPPGGYVAAAPITIWSQRAAEGVYPMTAPPPNATSSSNVMAKSAVFSTPIGEAIRSHDLSHDHPALHLTRADPALVRVSAGAELSVRALLRSLRERLTRQFGPGGVLRVQASLAAAGALADGRVDRDEFAAALRRVGTPITGREVAQLMSWFDTDRDGQVSVRELVQGLRALHGESTEGAGREGVVAQAWRVVAGGADTVSLPDVVARFHVAAYPPVREGRVTAEDALREVLRALDFERGAADGRVSRAEFVGFHESLSACIPANDAFDTLVRDLWGLPTTTTSASSSSSSDGSGDGSRAVAVPAGHRAVMVLHHDGLEEIRYVEDRIGLTAADEPAIRARLRKDGVTNIHSVRLLA